MIFKNRIRVLFIVLFYLKQEKNNVPFLNINLKIICVDSKKKERSNFKFINKKLYIQILNCVKMAPNFVVGGDYEAPPIPPTPPAAPISIATVIFLSVMFTLLIMGFFIMCLKLSVMRKFFFNYMHI